METFERIPKESRLSIDSAADLRINFKGETENLSVDFLSLRKLQNAFETDEEVNFEVKSLPKSLLNSTSYQKGDAVESFNDFTIRVSG